MPPRKLADGLPLPLIALGRRHPWATAPAACPMAVPPPQRFGPAAPPLVVPITAPPTNSTGRPHWLSVGKWSPKATASMADAGGTPRLPLRQLARWLSLPHNALGRRHPQCLSPSQRRPQISPGGPTGRRWGSGRRRRLQAWRTLVARGSYLSRVSSAPLNLRLTLSRGCRLHCSTPPSALRADSRMRRLGLLCSGRRGEQWMVMPSAAECTGKERFPVAVEQSKADGQGLTRSPTGR
jgi:hypothetical protein